MDYRTKRNRHRSRRRKQNSQGQNTSRTRRRRKKSTLAWMTTKAGPIFLELVGIAALVFVMQNKEIMFPSTTETQNPIVKDLDIGRDSNLSHGQSDFNSTWVLNRPKYFNRDHANQVAFAD